MEEAIEVDAASHLGAQHFVEIFQAHVPSENIIEDHGALGDTRNGR